MTILDFDVNIPVLQLASVCFVGSSRTNRDQKSQSEILHCRLVWGFHPASFGHRGIYGLSVWEGIKTQYRL